MFGGCVFRNVPNELFALDIENMRWSKVYQDDGTDSWPCGRFKTSFTRISPNRAVLYGGLKGNGDDYMLGDCWLLDLEKTKEGIDNPWTRCRHHEKEIRLQHSAVLEPESQRLWILGGQSNDFLHPTRILQLSFSSFTPLKVLTLEWVVNCVPLNDARLLTLPPNLRMEYKIKRSYRQVRQFFAPPHIQPKWGVQHNQLA